MCERLSVENKAKNSQTIDLMTGINIPIRAE